MNLPFLPYEAQIFQRLEEARDIFTLRLRFTDPVIHEAYSFQPGQFNMLYLYGVGEIPISIVSDPEDEHAYDHTIRSLGRVTRALAELKEGDYIGVRGAFGRGWPMQQAEGKDVVIITGGLGCAPVVSVINYVLNRREKYNRLVIMQGVKHANDLIWRSKYETWSKLPDTQVVLAASQGGQGWPWATGHITELVDQIDFDHKNCSVMMCGPEGMMLAAVKELLPRRVPETSIWLSMERNMQCAIGQCGHCQHGPKFVCKDGPVFNYPDVKSLLGVKGF
jgi:NAD(P)H-flavin reductase